MPCPFVRKLVSWRMKGSAYVSTTRYGAPLHPSCSDLSMVEPHCCRADVVQSPPFETYFVPGNRGKNQRDISLLYTTRTNLELCKKYKGDLGYAWFLAACVLRTVGSMPHSARSKKKAGLLPTACGVPTISFNRMTHPIVTFESKVRVVCFSGAVMSFAFSVSTMFFVWLMAGSEYILVGCHAFANIYIYIYIYI